MKSGEALSVVNALEKKKEEMYRSITRAGIEITESFQLDPQLMSPVREESFPAPNKATLTFFNNTSEACQRYLTGVYIKDHFTGKQERDDWEEMMRKQFGDMFTTLNDRSKLRRSFMGQIASQMEALIIFLKKPDSQIRSGIMDAIRRLHARINDPELKEYEEMSYEQKLQVAKHVDDIARSFLEIVSNPHAVKDPETVGFD